MTNPRIITLEGNIGAGKTTLLNALQEKYKDRTDVLFLLEPVDSWKEIQQNGKNILELFYAKKATYGFAFQVLAFQSRLQLIREACKRPNIRLIIMERSLDADYYVFAKMLYEEGFLEDCEYEIYKRMAKYEREQYMSDGIVWLRESPKTCMERVGLRARKGEERISLEYLEKCDQYHQEWLGADLGFVFTWDGNYDKLDRFLFG
jgi:deoxyadenosine/deoxycytidine kinase